MKNKHTHAGKKREITEERLSRPQIRPDSASLLSCPSVVLGLFRVNVKTRSSSNEQIVSDATWLNVWCNSMNYTETHTHTHILQLRAGSGVVRIDPLQFLAGCRTRRPNQV